MLFHTTAAEAVVAGLVRFEYIPSKQYTADYLTKNLPHYEDGLI